jgi:large subunit ribosomal protein L31
MPRRPSRPAPDDPEDPMKQGIHPKYYKAQVHCGTCGTEFEVGSTRESLRVDVCSSCHPFFTGKQMIVDTAGQVERFQRRLDRAQSGR